MNFSNLVDNASVSSKMGPSIYTLITVCGSSDCLTFSQIPRVVSPLVLIHSSEWELISYAILIRASG
jgi:hypothetical protein